MWAFKKDWPALIDIGEETRYIGDAIALIAAESEEIARKAMGLIKVDFEKLKPITSPNEALEKDAPKLHSDGNVLAREILKRGNVDEALKNLNLLLIINIPSLLLNMLF